MCNATKQACAKLLCNFASKVLHLEDANQRIASDDARMGTEMMKKKTILKLGLLLFIGIDMLIFAYPTISSKVNQRTQTQVVAEHKAQIESLSEEELAGLLNECQVYNANLAKYGIHAEQSADEQAAYQQISEKLDGILGYLDIKKIKVHLPIYAGCSEGTLASGLGHMESTSLPVGGESTHSFISGHTGIPSSILLTDLDQLAIGDIFTVNVLKQTLTYRVDDIQVVLPNDYRSIQIVEGMDYCTLVTCTPYGVNSHRLLVRGVRIDSGEITISRDADGVSKALPVRIVIIVSVLIFIIISFVRSLREKRREKIIEEHRRH